MAPVPDRETIVIIGAGGHARVVADLILVDHPQFDLIGAVDPDPAVSNLAGRPILGDDEVLADLQRNGLRLAVVGLGDNSRRAQAAANLARLGLSSPVLVSARASISPGAVLGQGVVVMPGAVINTGARVGDFAIVNSGAVVEHDCVVGDFAHLAPNSTLTGGARLGEGALLGAGATVIPGRTVGARAIVGAGACVVADLPADVVALGVPARIVSQSSSR